MHCSLHDHHHTRHALRIVCERLGMAESISEAVTEAIAAVSWNRSTSGGARKLYSTVNSTICRHCMVKKRQGFGN